MQILELDELRVRERGDNGCLKYCEGERSALSSRGFVFSGVVGNEWGQLALPHNHPRLLTPTSCNYVPGQP